MAKKTKTTEQFSEVNEAEQLRLTHAVLVNNTCTYSHSVRLDNGESDIVTNQCGREYHEDLRLAFRLLDGHLAVVTEQVEAEEVKDIEVPIGINQKVTDKLLQVEVSDFKIVGNLETGSVILSGQKLLKSKEELKLKSQKVAFDGDYDFVQDLVGAVSNLINEISLYHKGKSRVDPQLDMFEDQND